MTRYRIKPVRFWIANFMLAPLAGAILALVVYYLLAQVMPDSVMILVNATGMGLILAMAFFLSAYVYGFFVTLLYAVALGLWQAWRGGHSVIEALLIGWLSTGIVTGGYMIFSPERRLLEWFVWSAAVALPLMWFVCLWSGITYKLKSEPAPSLETAA